MVKTFRGRISGRIVELDEDAGVDAGEQVEITIKTLPQPAAWADGLQRCAGVLAEKWTTEDDRILEEIQQSRKLDTRGDTLE